MSTVVTTKGDVTVKNVIPKHLEATTAKLIEIGCEVEEFDDAVRVVSSKPLHHTQVTTLTVSWLSNRYAATDVGAFSISRRNKYRNGEYF